jgi:sec-independent protein translocase protein TatA
MLQTLAIGMPGPFEFMVIAGLALLIFGNRLPSVARNLAVGIREFKHGLKDGGKDETKSLPDRE